jgi:hypothetical protein
MRLFSLVLAACRTSPDAALPVEALPPPPVLEVAGVVEGWPLDVTLATRIAGAHVRLLRSPLPPEPGPCPPAFGGACLGLGGVVLAGEAVADPTGQVTFSLLLDAVGEEIVSLQAVVQAGRRTWVTEPVGRRVLRSLEDADNDGLTNTMERSSGCDPLRPDSDGGGTLDGQEVRDDHTSPIDPLDDVAVEANCWDYIDGDLDGRWDCADPDCGCAERCDVPGDEDRNYLDDCEDPDCVGHPACVEVCTGGVDDDGDNRTDCADADCATSLSCERRCANLGDDDADGFVDCADRDCQGLSMCPQSGEFCGDGADNDGDGAVDCRDSSCSSLSMCDEDCTNSRDDDLDGATDCSDYDCRRAAVCQEDCDNGVDDDGDRLVDDADGACRRHKEMCGDGIDNDVNGDVDCADWSCQDACFEICGNGLDDDGDSVADCADPDCLRVCREACADGADNDADGDVDCRDADCWGRCSEFCGNRVDDDLDGRIDCADEACACVERCDNGQDDDRDGLADCADGDCSGTCGEDCTNGFDDDHDGLTDCEDGACTDLCVETCGNGTDDDGDAWTDCQDEECWSDPLCPVAEQVAWVIDGDLRTRRFAVDWRSWWYPCASSNRAGVEGTVEDVRGLLRVVRAGRELRCSWSVDEVTMSRVQRTGRESVFTWTTTPGGYQMVSSCHPFRGTSFDLRRTGLRVAPGCGVVGSAFLPARLSPGDGTARIAGGGPWYGGGPVYSVRHGSTYWSTSFWPGTSQGSTYTFTAGPLRAVGAFGICEVGPPSLIRAPRVPGGSVGICTP